jgi:hypothetical protein
MLKFMPHNERDLLVGFPARGFFLPGDFGEEI